MRESGPAEGTPREASSQAERRFETLSALTERLHQTTTVADACVNTAQLLRRGSADVAFALVYLLDDAADSARLVSAAGIGAGWVDEARRAQGAGWPWRVALGDDAPWPLRTALAQGAPSKRFTLPARAREAVRAVERDAPTEAALLLLRPPGRARPQGFMVVGLGPELLADAGCASFLRAISALVSSALTCTRAFEDEQRRVAALTELDRAKTVFLSRVSHELRTPLTLLMGPVEDALAQEEGQLAGDALTLVYRSALRLLKLVQSLLSFSRLEARRLAVVFAPTSLAPLTAGLVGSFRSAIEHAGLRLDLDLDADAEPAFVDRWAWEQIVLNLVSNAFKFTFEGAINVALRQEATAHVLEVRDTGVGIPPRALAHVFEHFHPTENARGRTDEGAGIGLALVRGLVELHGGQIAVRSDLGVGSVFTVRVPRGSRHLPDEQLALDAAPEASPRGTQPFVEEALCWLPDDGIEPGEDARQRAQRRGHVPNPDATILIVDDNADMRLYLAHILGQHWRVETARDGAEALAAIEARPPALVVADVRMPGVDGFALLKALRAAPQTKQLPVIFLTARAEEEVRVEGIDQGANDYLIKPFSARELIARVRLHLELDHLRAEEMARIRAARAQAEAANRAKDEFLAMLGHELRNPLAPIATALQLMDLRDDPGNERERAIIGRQVRHLSALVDDLLDVSRVVRGKVALNRRVLSLEGAITRGVELASPLIERHLHTLDLDVDPSLTVDADPMRLAQVFANLLTNAAKYTPDGGLITLRAAADPDGARAVVRVIDDGIGVDPELLPHIFDLFTQGHAGMDRAIGGLGLGLALVKNLIALHGGSVEARSQGKGHGSEFIVWLPLSQANALDPITLPPPMDFTPLSSGLRVLFVDDNEDAAEMLSLLLEARGHEVLTVHDAVSAIARAPDFLPDVALLDIGLPVMSGYELAGHLREHISPLVLVAVTGYGQPHDIQRAMDAGFDHHLVKPVQFERLTAILDALVSAKNSSP